MDLMELLPNYYRGNVTMEKLQSILAEKIQALANDINETIDQCFVNFIGNCSIIAKLILKMPAY